MPEASHLLAEANVARMKGPLDSEIMEGFARQLAAINAAADHSPGFVWRLQTEAGDSTDVRAFDDDSILLNLSVWTSIEDLHFYVYRGAHSGPFRDRRQWFEPIEQPLVLWWIEAHHRPTVEEAIERFALLRERGPTPAAFTFKQSFPPPGQRATRELRHGPAS